VGETCETKILGVDDDRVTRRLLGTCREKEGYVNLLDADGLELLHQIKAISQHAVVILMTGFGSLSGALEAVKRGAFDYLPKPVHPKDLLDVVRKAHRHWLRSFEAAPGPGPTAEPPREDETEEFIGNSPKIVEAYKTVAKAALATSNVLILGESGTGKELVARAIHDHSARRDKPFVSVNCGALSETLLASELFGHVRGAFTGAVGSKEGLFREAHGGTLFLDEIGDISTAMQVKLLRVVQSGEVRSVGGNQTAVVDTRVIAATHRSLEAMVATGEFREDLFYRLKVISVCVPPLRERRADIPELVQKFVQRFARRNGKQVWSVSKEAPWPTLNRSTRKISRQRFCTRRTRSRAL